MPAKKAAKTAKKAAKKAAKKVEAVHIEDPETLPTMKFQSRVRPGSKDVYGTMAANVRKSIEIVSGRSKTRPVSLMTPAMMSKMILPFEEIVFQNMISSIGFRCPSVVEIVAPEHIGKTSLCFSMIGAWAQLGCYSLYVECEGKAMAMKRAARFLHKDKATAKLLLNTIEFGKARSLAECDEVIQKAVPDLRKRCDADPDTKGNPIIIFLDPWSGLMSHHETKGRYDWGMAANAPKESAKDAAVVSNMGHSKHLQMMKRWLPAFLEANNAIIVFVNHQNTKVDMGGFKMKSFVAPSESDNDTTIGGRALRQFASYRFVMVPAGDIKNKDKKTIGLRVKMKMKKNAYGPKNRTANFTLFYDDHLDTSTEYDTTLTWGEETAAWMAQNRVLATTVKDGLYTCDTLGCVAVKGDVLAQALKDNPDQLAFIGSALEIEGYESEVDAQKRQALLENLTAEAVGDSSDDEEEESEEEDTDGGEKESEASAD